MDPLSSKEPYRDTPPPGAPPASEAALRILFVDDDLLIVRLSHRMLEPIGHRVVSFTDPRDALLAVEKEPEAFDVMVTDIDMPHLSAHDLLPRVRAVAPQLPVVVISGRHDLLDGIGRDPSLATVQKPFRRQDLMDGIQRAVVAIRG